MTQEAYCKLCNKLLQSEKGRCIKNEESRAAHNEELDNAIPYEAELIKHQRHLIEELDLVLKSPSFSIKKFLSPSSKDKDKTSRQDFFGQSLGCQGKHRYKRIDMSDTEMTLICKECGLIS